MRYVPTKNMNDSIDFIKGDILETIPRRLEKNTQGRTALLNLDMDVYELTKVALEYLCSRVVVVGVVVIDDCNAVGGTCRPSMKFLPTRPYSYRRTVFFTSHIFLSVKP